MVLSIKCSLKKRIGSHDLAKRKREEMQSVIQAMRKKAAA